MSSTEYLGTEAKIAILLALMLVSSVTAGNYNDFLGVTKGSWAIYKVETGWYSTETNDAPPSLLLDINQTRWNVTVLEILSPDTLKLQVIKELNNGTTEVEVYEGSVRSNSSELKCWVVRKNLDVGEKIYENEEIRVNNTKYLKCGGAFRWLIFSSSEYKDISGGDLRGITNYSICWDRETGILCSMLLKQTEYKDDQNFTVSRIWIHLTETNLWTAIENPNYGDFWYLGVITVICALVFFSLICRYARRKKGRIRRIKTRKF